MNELAMQELLEEALYNNDKDNEKIKNIKTFDSAMTLTKNRGLIVKMNDGSEFQITIVKSR